MFPKLNFKFQLWGESATKKVFNNINKRETEDNNDGSKIAGPHNQGCLNSYFTEYNRIRLPRK